MVQKNNSVPSDGTADKLSAKADVTTSSPNNAKPNVGRSPKFYYFVLLFMNACVSQPKSISGIKLKNRDVIKIGSENSLIFFNNINEIKKVESIYVKRFFDMVNRDTATNSN